MKANNRRKVFGDAVDLLMEDIEEKTAPGGLRMLSIKKIRPFHDHPFHLYEGERLEDMVASVREHGILNPVIVQEIDGGYEMLSGHNRMNAAKLVGLKDIPAIVKTDLSEEEAYVYVIETNLMQRSFSDLLISEKAAVLKVLCILNAITSAKICLTVEINGKNLLSHTAKRICQIQRGRGFTHATLL